MGVTPRNIPVPGHLPFNPMVLDPNRPLSWDEILRMPGNNILKNLYYANERWEASKAYAAVLMQQQANLAAQEQMNAEDSHRTGRADLPDINAEGRDPYEVLESEGVDTSSGSLEELAEDLRAKRAIELIYTPAEETYGFVESMLSALNRSLNLMSFRAAMMASVTAEAADSHRSLKDRLLDDLYQHRPDMTFQNWIIAEYFVHRLANALLSLGYTADNYAAALHASGDEPAYVRDFENHVNKMSALATQCRNEVNASDVPEIEPHFFQKPTPFQMPVQKEGQPDEEWRYDVALRYVQSNCPHATTLRTLPQEQANQLQAQQHRATPFALKPEAPAPEPSAKEKLEYIATDVLMVPLETLMTRAVYGAMRALGATPMGPEMTGSEIEMQALKKEEDKRKAPSPFEKPKLRPEDQK